MRNARHPLFLLSSVRKRMIKKAGTLELRDFPVHMLCFVIRGEGMLLVNDIACRIEPLQLFSFQPGMRIQVSVSREIHYYTLAFKRIEMTVSGSKWTIDETGKTPFLLPEGFIALHKTKLFLERINRIYEHETSALVSSLDKFERQLKFQELIHFVLQDLSGQMEKRSGSKGVERTTEYMRRHSQEKLSLELLSEMAGLTPSSYSRIFKKKTGISPIEYLTRIRIDNAKEMLADNDCLIRDVSASVGYDNEFYFSRVFHRVVGVAPTLYMKRKTLRVAVASCLQMEHNLITLDVQPVYTLNVFKYPGTDEEEYKLRLDFQLKKLTAAKPDLIIADHYHRLLYDSFCAIAPTIVLGIDSDWRVNYRKMADLVGRLQEAEQTMARLAFRIGEAREQFGAMLCDRTVTVMQINHLMVRIHGAVKHPLNDLLYRELGLKPGKYVPLNDQWQELKPERLPPFGPDYLFIQKNHIRAGSEKVFQRMKNTEMWKSLHPLLDDRVRMIPNWFSMSWTPIGRSGIIDELLGMTEERRKPHYKIQKMPNLTI